MDAPAASPPGTPMQSWSWLEKWSEWEIQAVVLVSFGLQVILFFFAGIRRYSTSTVLRVFLWLAYLTADGVAIYALGHMSASLSKISSDRHQLVAFWAPFLLLHLGGQDTITAFAVEDNKLWVRHLLNMSVQAAGTGYLLHKYIIADRETIVSAAVLISVAGIVKYGERIWALKMATDFRYFGWISIPMEKAEKNCFAKNKKFAAYELILMTAHGSLNGVVKPLIMLPDETDTGWIRGFVINPIIEYVDGLLDQGDVSTREKKYADEVYRVIEMQLALYYDALFTKAEVIHTWFGYLLHSISFVSCIGALVAFTRSKRDRYSTPDTVISFVLLGGACVLEVVSAFKVIGSSWTPAFLRSQGLDPLARLILFARCHLIVVKDGRWSNSVGQFDFMSYCGIRTRRWIGLEKWWDKGQYTKHVKLSPALKEIVWGLIRGEKSGMVQIEDLAIRSGYWARRLTGFSQSEELDWSLRLEIHDCVYVWHVATSSFLTNPTVKSKLVDTSNTVMAEAVNSLSHYMMYLLLEYPDILPRNAFARKLFLETYRHFKDLKRTSDENLDFMYEFHFHGEPTDLVLRKASFLLRKMLDMELELTHKLVIIGRVWTEMLCYTATNASGDFHARQLSNGGEFLTHILLLSKYISTMPRIVQDRYRAADDQHVEVDVPDVGGHVELKVYHDSDEVITESR